jgi:hypothetical protein
MRTVTRLFSRSTGRFVACIAGAVLVLCQTAAAAEACMTGAPSSGNSAVEQPCHDSAQKSGQDEHSACQTQCLSQRAAPAETKVSVPAATDMPALTVRLDQPLFAAHAAPFPKLLTARADSPPLTILHCRLVI